MEATTAETQPAPESVATLPRYVRIPEHGILAGVAAGLAVATGIDVIGVRIALVVLVFLHGAGLLVYLAAWIALPTLADAGTGRRPRYRALRLVAGATLAAAAVIVVVTPFGFDAWELAPLLVGIGVALWRSNPPRNLLPPIRPAKSGDFAGTPGGPATPAAAPSSPGLPIGRVTLAVVMLAVALALALGRAGWVSLTAGRAASLVLILLGVSLVAGALVARPRLTVLLALALVPVTIGLGTLDRMGLDIFAPSGSYRVAASSPTLVPNAVRHGVGDVILDFSGLSLAAGDSRSVTVYAALGNVTVWVPAGTAVRMDAVIGWGAVDQPLFPTSWSVGVAENLQLPGDKGNLILHVRSGVGTITVLRASPDSQPVGP